MEIYDRTKIGRCLAWAGDHFVFEYGADEVIKFSKLNVLRGRRRAQQKYIADYTLCKKFLGPYILQTRLASSPEGFLLALIQPKISGDFLGTFHLWNPQIRDQYAEFLLAYERLVAESHSEIDLIGNHGLFRAVLSNIFVTSDGKLILFDAMLMSLKEFSWWSWPLMFPIYLLGQTIQRLTLSRFKKILRYSLEA